ncbi:MAG TPA: hypothetical protein VFC65_14155 [Prolixibacteraceae bacterium]|nr:hypothetical protein [Prolixibacteraceae bacterium]
MSKLGIPDFNVGGTVNGAGNVNYKGDINGHEVLNTENKDRSNAVQVVEKELTQVRRDYAKAWYYGIPVVGPALESGDNLGRGNYSAATAAFGMALFDVATLGSGAALRSAGKTAGEAGTRAFFSGAGAEARAIEQGYQTLGQTGAGQNLQNLITSKNIPLSEAEPMWQRLSSVWAKGVPAGSTVPVFLNSPRAGAVWFQTELPILQLNKVNLIYK